MALFLKSDGGGEHIPVDIAKGFINKYIDEATGKRFGFEEAKGVNAAIAFDRDSLSRVLGPLDSNCSGLRLYFGIEPSEQGIDALVIIMVGIDSKGNDIGFDDNGEPLPSLQAEETGTETTSIIPKQLIDTNRAFLLEYAQRKQNL